jgi:hypothetical protein
VCEREVGAYLYIVTEAEKLAKSGRGDSEWLNKAGMRERVQTSRQ